MNIILNDLREYMENNDLDNAYKLISEYDTEKSIDFLKLESLFYIKIGDCKKALEVLNLAKRINHNDLEIYYYESNAYKFLYESMSIPENIIIDTSNKDSQAVAKEKNLFKIRNEMANLLISEDAPEVSIYLFAYNQLEERTKICVESILRNTKDVNYELILVNNGSTDGTLDYFNSINYKNKKVINITKNLGAIYGCQFTKYASGRYIMYITNDIFVTENWLSNMLTCIKSDNRIGLVVPTSSNVSNWQQPSVKINYNNLIEMEEGAKNINKSNPHLWEERLRLVTIAALCRKECMDTMGFYDYGFLHNFADDEVSFKFRRNGYKLILCRDVFVHHISSNINDKFIADINLGRGNFKEKFYGIDAWDDCNEYQFEYLDISDYHKSNANILGVNVKAGTPLLTIKNKLRKIGIYDVKLSAFSGEAKYFIDLKTISDGEVKISDSKTAIDLFKDSKFDFIVFGEIFSENNYDLLIDSCNNILNDQGYIFFKFENVNNVHNLVNYITYERLNSLQEAVQNLANKIKYNVKSLNVVKVTYSEFNDGFKDEFKEKYKYENIDSIINEANIKELIISIEI